MKTTPEINRNSPPSTLNRRQFLTLSAALLGGLSLTRTAKCNPPSLVGDWLTRQPKRSGFSFLHTYESTGRYWQALEQVGLIRKSNGIRFVQSPWGEDEHHFNHVARQNGPLHQILSRRQCPFIVDRVAGGSPYQPYPFDHSLTQSYSELLGNNFLGGQIHEPICNTHNDWGRFVAADAKFKKEAVLPEELRSYFNHSGAQRWLEYGTVDDYAGRVHPPDEPAFWPEIKWNIERNVERFGSNFSCAEGSGWGQLAWHLLYKWGARYCFAEVGPWASSNSQLAIASVRGAARAAGRPWGVYFAPWGPNGCTSFLPPQDWTWRCPPEELEASSWPVGPELGPSSALQRRIFFHAYLSGAHTLHEEWGAEGNLESWTNPKLSSYGRVTRDLLDFEEAYPDVGQPFTPLALVLDAQTMPPGGEPWNQLLSSLSNTSEAGSPNVSQFGKAEAVCYPAWVIPEIFDIVPSDAPAEVWNGYQSIVAFDQSVAPEAARIVEPGGFASAAIQAARDLSPIEYSANFSVQINHRPSDSAWIVALYNPWGAERGDVYATGSVLDPASAQHTVLKPKFSFSNTKVLYAWPEESKLIPRENELEVTIGPGGILVLEIHPEKNP